MSIQVTGLTKVVDGLMKGIREYTEKTSKATMMAGLKVEYFVKEATPVRTGNLRSNINTQMVSQGVEKSEAFVGTNVAYAPFVEFGTSKMQPRAMFRQAIDEHGKEIWEIYNNYLKK